MVRKENSNIFIPKLLKSAFKIEEDIDLSMNTKSIRETLKDVTKFKNYCIYIYKWKAGYLKTLLRFLIENP